MIMAATLTQILQSGLDLLADKDLIHQVIPTGGFGQFPDQACRRFLYRGIFRRRSHGWNQPQNRMECKPLSCILAGKNGPQTQKSPPSSLLAGKRDGNRAYRHAVMGLGTGGMSQTFAFRTPGHGL